MEGVERRLNERQNLASVLLGEGGAYAFERETPPGSIARIISKTRKMCKSDACA